MFRSPVVDAIVVLVIVLLIMGPKRLPGIGRGLGQGMREFKEGITGESPADPEKAALPEASATPQPATAAERAASAASAPGPERSA